MTKESFCLLSFHLISLEVKKNKVEDTDAVDSSGTDYSTNCLVDESTLSYAGFAVYSMMEKKVDKQQKV